MNLLQDDPLRETRRPLPNRPKAGFWGSLRFQARLCFDFQVATVHRSLRRFLAGGLRGNVLEVGGGLSPYRHLIRTDRYWSLDPYRLEGDFGYASKSIKYDGTRFPFKSGSFDTLLHTEVMEHVFDTNALLGECSRVLKPGGSMFFTVPFSARVHYKPHDYWRFTPFSLERLCSAHGFTVASITARGDDWTVILNKLMGLLVFPALGFREGTAEGFLKTLLFGPAAALLLPAMALAGHARLGLKGASGSGDCLGYSVVCVRNAG